MGAPKIRFASLTIASSRTSSAVLGTAGRAASDLDERFGAPDFSAGRGLMAATSSCGGTGTLTAAGEGGSVVGRSTASGNAGAGGLCGGAGGRTLGLGGAGLGGR